MTQVNSPYLNTTKHIGLLDLDDVAIVPAVISNVSSRSECSVNAEDPGIDNLPIFTAPMPSVLNADNYSVYTKEGINVVIPSIVAWEERERLMEKHFVAVTLDEAENFLSSEWENRLLTDGNVVQPKIKICIDVANGHMARLIDTCKRLKTKYPGTFVIMTGNIANPATYYEYAKAGIDYVRLSIGTGSACTTGANGGIMYGMASLIAECRIRKEILQRAYNTYPLTLGYKWSKKRRLNFLKYNEYCGPDGEIFHSVPKIIADGGMSNFDRINKALACGADYVMVGRLLAQTWESAYPPHVLRKSFDEATGRLKFEDMYEYNGKMIAELNEYELREMFRMPFVAVVKQYWGLSTKRAQRDRGRENEKLRTSEGIEFSIDVKYTLKQWVENFKGYLTSAMSYTGVRTLEDFKNCRERGNLYLQTPTVYKQYHK